MNIGAVTDQITHTVNASQEVVAAAKAVSAQIAAERAAEGNLATPTPSAGGAS